MLQEILSAITNVQRPSSKWQRQMIRVVVDEIRKYNPNPTRSQCRTICHKIVMQYPKNFADMTEKGVLIAGGFTLLLQQVKTRIENINGGGLYRQRSVGCRGETGPQRGPVDTYGCTRFQPEPPKEETTDTLEEKRYRMENIYRQEGLNGTFFGVNPERGSKPTHGKVVSKRTGKVIQKRAASVNPHVATLLKNLLDFEWDFM
ncbi:hypothetical protein AOLI_G00320740 [Acnodon oligacanthus]